MNIQKDLEIINKILLEKYNFVQPVINNIGNDLCNEAPPKRLKYEEEISTDDNRYWNFNFLTEGNIFKNNLIL